MSDEADHSSWHVEREIPRRRYAVTVELDANGSTEGVDETDLAWAVKSGSDIEAAGIDSGDGMIVASCVTWAPEPVSAIASVVLSLESALAGVPHRGIERLELLLAP